MASFDELAGKSPEEIKAIIDAIRQQQGITKPVYQPPKTRLNSVASPVRLADAGDSVNMSVPPTLDDAGGDYPWPSPRYEGRRYYGGPPAPQYTPPAPEAVPQYEPSAITKALQTAHGYLDPTQYFGGTLNTAMMGLPAAPLVRGAIAAAQGLPAAARGVAFDAKYTPQQWAQLRRSGITNYFRNKGGFGNVADDAVVSGERSFEAAAPKPTGPQPFDFAGARAQAMRNPRPRPVNQIAEYTPLEKARVRQAALRARKQNRIIDELSEKGMLDSRTYRIMRGVR